MSALAPPQWHDCSFSCIAQYWGFPPPSALWPSSGWLARPAKRNALSDGLMLALRNRMENVSPDAKAAVLCGDSDGSAMLLVPSSILSIYPFTCPKLPCKLKDVAPFSVACFFSHGVGPAVLESVKTLKNFLP